jgi:aquaporin Z
MTVILIVVYSKGLKGFVGLAIGGMAGLDIFFLSFISFISFISGAFMNPARSLAPALLSGVVEILWIYWTATFVGTSLIAFIFRSHF